MYLVPLVISTGLFLLPCLSYGFSKRQKTIDVYQPGFIAFCKLDTLLPSNANPLFGLALFSALIRILCVLHITTLCNLTSDLPLMHWKYLIWHKLTTKSLTIGNLPSLKVWECFQNYIQQPFHCVFIRTWMLPRPSNS